MCNEEEKVINITNAEDLLTLTRVIAQLQSENANLKVENKDLSEWSERYRKWWREALDDAEKLNSDSKEVQS
jgi:hypothetical protein